MTRKKCVVEMVFLLLLAAIFAWGTAMENQQQRLANEMIRLHVVANSNSYEDQELKLQVRDAVLSAADEILESCNSVTDAKSALSGNLSRLQSVANETLLNLGVTDRALITLERELFGTREYETFSLPGGYYDALRVEIGSGEGKNWWCVVYPQICMASSVSEQTAVAAMAGMREEDIAMIQRGTDEYELKFKTLEIFENILGWFRSRQAGIPTSG